MKNLLPVLIVLMNNFCYGQQQYCNFLPAPPSGYQYNNREATVNIPLLNSYPTSSRVIYLDFDGQVVQDYNWANGNVLNCQPSGLTEDQIREVFAIVSEDYSSFNINVTTDETVFNTAALHNKMRVIFTPTSSWMLNVGGVAMLNSFSSPLVNNTPCFVFTDRLYYDAKYAAESCSHEVGHTLGLFHQSLYDNNCNLLEDMNEGLGPVTSEISWAPLMGMSYYRNQTTWANGQIFNCNQAQDNISTILTYNHITLRPRTTNITYTIDSILTFKGLILPNKIDTFYIVVNDSTSLFIHSTSGGNTDTKIRMNGLEGNDPASLNADLTVTVPPGTYMLEVMGVDNQYLPDYGNTGQFDIQIISSRYALLANSRNEIYSMNGNINWSIDVRDFRKVIIQKSDNGTNFTDYLPSNTANGHFPYSASHTTYFRNKVFNASGQILYSRILAVKGTIDQWLIYDISGRLIRKGSGDEDYNGLPHGTYILRTTGSSRIIVH